VAKLKAPLFSFSASGKIADALVYFDWKGLSVVRSFVVPANPKTASQTTQRGYLTEAVAKIHAVQVKAANPLDQDDISAYSLLGSTHPTPRTWFNEAAKRWIDCRVVTKIPIIYSDGTISDKTAASIDIIFYVNPKTDAKLAAGKFYFGSSKTSLIHSVAATIDVNGNATLANSDCSAFLTAGNKYYVQFKPDAADPCEGAVSGIYSFVAG